MKLAGIAGRGSGKMGSMVFASVGGGQVVRQYQPSVANPNTSAQVQQRSKFKLMSQLSAAVADQIAIPKQGMKSSRNLFVKKNIGNVSVENGAAVIPYADLQFTAGSIAFPGVSAVRTTTGIDVNLTEPTNIDRVIYLVYEKTQQESLRFIVSAIIEEPGEYKDFPTVLGITDDVDLVIYGYGMRDLGANATAKYGNYNVTTGTALASLIANRTLGASDFQVSETSGITLFSGQSDTTTQAIVGGQFSYVGSNGQVYETLVPNGAIVMAAGGQYPNIQFQMNTPFNRSDVNSLKFIDSNDNATDLDFVTGASGIVVTDDDYDDVASTLGKAGKYVVTIDSVGYEWPVVAA